MLFDDDFSRYIISWRLSPTRGAEDVKDTLDYAIATHPANSGITDSSGSLISDWRCSWSEFETDSISGSMRSSQARSV